MNFFIYLLFRIQFRIQFCLCCFVLCFFFFFVSCFDIHIPPIDTPEASPRGIIGDALPISIFYLEFKGSDLQKRDWVQALSISRFFFSGVENKSGSLVNLLEPAVKAIIKKKGYDGGQIFSIRSSIGSSIHSIKKGKESKKSYYMLSVNIKRHRLFWLPPVEFIQTPTPRKKGEISLDFFIETEIIPIFIQEGITSQKKRYGTPIWKDSFYKKEVYSVFPGNEKEMLELFAHSILSAYIERIHGKLPNPKNLSRLSTLSITP